MSILSIINKEAFSSSDLKSMLEISDINELELLKKKAYDTMSENCGEHVYLRGLIEFSNYCIHDCYYCGIRKSNSNIKRYTLEGDDIINSALWCADKGYGSLVLQSGERTDKNFIDYVVALVETIKTETKSEKLPNGLGITLCVGEQTLETYKRFFEAGAHRYLLRIETSNEELYKKFHPEEQLFSKRVQALIDLKTAGFQVGTGVMIGLPGQSIEDLVNDILFFKDFEIDMIGMGPYIVHNQTPMSELSEYYKGRKSEIYQLALKMIAVTRIYLKNVNIAATTALQAMYAMGREAALMYGANIIMPLLTPTEVREQYTLYDGKPCLDEFSSDCFECIQKRIESTGRDIGIDLWGDSKHFLNNQ